MQFRDRADGGTWLAEKLAAYALRSDVTVLAISPAGVPVAVAASRALGVAVGAFPVSPILAPGPAQPVLGAIAPGGVAVLDEQLIERRSIPHRVVEQAAVQARLRLERSRFADRAAAAAALAEGRVIILIDDSLIHASAAEAAMLALQPYKPASMVVAAPIVEPETVFRLESLADEVVFIAAWKRIGSLDEYFGGEAAVDEEKAERLLLEAAHTPAPAGERARPPALEVVRGLAQPLQGDSSDFDALLDGIGSARLVLIGEATHGTHEFYRIRSLITRRLIEEKGFAAVAVEADWPDAYRINRYVRGQGNDREAIDALGDFRRFPTWMWRNADVLDFIGWLRTRNESRPAAQHAGFYGLDLYSLHSSMEAVLAYLRKVDPGAVAGARARYACFDRFGGEVQAYAYAAGSGLLPSCEREVVVQLADLHRRRADYASRNGRVAPDDYFFAEQNARLVKNAEEYYRTMLRGHVESWNLRDRHMVETLRDLLTFLDKSRPGGRVVIWAHNSHLGDARATEMGTRGELNVGQLVRERFSVHDVVLVGFTTSTGTVTAASEWDGDAQRKRLRAPLPGSYERLFHETGVPRFLLPIRTDPALAQALMEPRLERAVGVLYVPATERASHYFHATLARQFDYVFHFDETRAVEPLERAAAWEAGELADTYPSGL
jgi:erythromycin esterase-like protein/predicted phosphoribosyltransferase